MRELADLARARQKKLDRRLRRSPGARPAEGPAARGRDHRLRRAPERRRGDRPEGARGARPAGRHGRDRRPRPLRVGRRGGRRARSRWPPSGRPASQRLRAEGRRRGGQARSRAGAPPTGRAGSATRGTESGEEPAAPSAAARPGRRRRAWRRSPGRFATRTSRRASPRSSRFGYRVRLAPNVLAREPLLGLAGERRRPPRGLPRRSSDDPEVDAILFARGGYGVTRSSAACPRSSCAESAKLHCGFSDVTALSAFLRDRCGLVLDSRADGRRGPGEAPRPAHGRLVPGDSWRDGRRVASRSRRRRPRPGPRRGAASSGDACRSSPRSSERRGSSTTTARSSSSRRSGEEAYRIDRMLGTLVSGRATRTDWPVSSWAR